MSVAKDSPAEAAGIKPGDVFLQVTTAKYESADAGPFVLTVDKIKDFQDFTKAHASEQLDIKIKRGREVFDVLISPRVDYPKDQGALGVALERMANVIKKYPWYEAPIQGILFTGQVTWQAMVGVYGFFASLFSGNGLPPGAQLAGPVGITLFLSRAADYGVGFFLYFIGSLSVLLALFNLFPIPALDGGKLVFLLIEKVMKKPVPVAWEQWLTIVCFIILITMSIFITIKFDVPRVMDFWKADL
jgi:regulator of sigma E protease